VQEEIKKEAAADRAETERTVQEAIAEAQRLENAMPIAIGADKTTATGPTGEQPAVTSGPADQQPAEQNSLYPTQYPQQR
jgi:hypothetical protein